METTTQTPTLKDRETFVIEDERGADWLLAKIGGIRAEQEQIAAQAATRHAELESDYNRLYHLYGAQLEAFARQESDRRRRKTVTMLHGTIAFRATPERFVLEDDGIAFAEAEEHYPQAIRVRRDLDKAAYLDHAKRERDTTGQILPGVSVAPAAETFRISFGKKTAE